MYEALQRSFNGGEADPDVWSRDDLAQVGRAFRLGRNGVCLIQGPIEKRKGFWLCGVAKGGGVARRLKAFTRQSRQSVILEMGTGYVRVWGLDRQRVGTFEVATPFSADEVTGLSFTQSNDVLYIFRRNHKRPQVLKRLGVETWTCSDWGCRNGPWLPENRNDGPSLTIGLGTLTASEALFTAQDVGGLLRVKSPNGYSQADGWRSDWDPQNEEICTHKVNYYRNAGTDTKKTGWLAPVHKSGTMMDGSGGASTWGVPWTYLHDGKTTYRITAVSSATVVTVEAVDGVCVSAGDVTGFWSRGAYNDRFGWPSISCIHAKRFVTGSTLTHPSYLDLSQVQGFGPDYADYTPGLADGTVEADDAVRTEITGSGAELHWCISAGVLMIGASDGVWMLVGGDVIEPIAPGKDEPVLIGHVAAEPVAPALAPDSLIYVGNGAQTLCEVADPRGTLSYDDTIALMFAHITKRRVKKMLFMGFPHNRLVLVLEDGGFAFVTYSRRQQVYAATQQSITGCTVQDAEVVEGPDGVQQLWLLVEYQGQQLVLCQAGPDEDMYLDLAERYDGAETISIAGLDHLSGDTVSARSGEGRWYPGLTVSGGGVVSVPKDYGAARFDVGLPIDFRFEDMPLGAQQRAWADQRFQPKVTEIAVTGRAYSVCTTDDEDGDSEKEAIIRTNEITGLPEAARFSHKFALSGWRSEDKRIVIDDHSPYALKIHSVYARAE